MHSMGQSLFVAVMAFVISFISPFSSRADGLLTARTLDRNADAVIVSGDSMPDFYGTSLGHLFIYAYRDNQWQQIPWQFDEVKDGEYIASDNNKLDAADELVVMGGDCGDQVTNNNWIDDEDARLNKRYEITVVDPLDTEKLGWIYVYCSTSLADTVTQDYVDFDYNSSVFTTPVYKLAFFLQYLGGYSLELNGSGVNVLDRSKFRLKAPEQDVFDEEFMEVEDPQPKILDGRVRAIAGYQEEGQGILTFGYRSAFYDLVTIDFSWAPRSFEWVRASADFNENIAGGTYYDANTPSGLLVDGQPDLLETSPASMWQQISSSTGTVIHTVDVAPMLGTTSTYYNDNDQVDPSDTGDKVSYGEMGLTVANPINYVYLAVTHYILPPNQPNVGADYYACFSHPLEYQANSSEFEVSVSEETPQSFILYNNYPNPFNPSTTISYQLGKSQDVQISIYNVSGQIVAHENNGIQSPGMHAYSWDASDLSAGVYVCAVRAGLQEKRMKILLMK